MSPARSLLVACACAALLHAASSAELRDSHLNLRINDKCTPKTIGEVTSDVVQLPIVQIEAGVKRAEIQIPDACKADGKKMTGETVTACDSDVNPDVVVGPWPYYTPAVVIRNGSLKTTADVSVAQYCVA